MCTYVSVYNIHVFGFKFGVLIWKVTQNNSKQNTKPNKIKNQQQKLYAKKKINKTETVKIIEVILLIHKRIEIENRKQNRTENVYTDIFLQLGLFILVKSLICRFYTFDPTQLQTVQTFRFG